MFKCHVLSFIEGATPAIYDAATSVLKPLDDIQDSFLAEIGISRFESLRDFSLAPLSMRRDIAMLGLLWKFSRRIAPSPIQSLFVLGCSGLESCGFTSTAVRHAFQLHDPIAPGHPVMLRRSIFGLIRVWNALPSMSWRPSL